MPERMVPGKIPGISKRHHGRTFFSFLQAGFGGRSGTESEKWKLKKSGKVFYHSCNLHSARVYYFPFLITMKIPGGTEMPEIRTL